MSPRVPESTHDITGPAEPGAADGALRPELEARRPGQRPGAEPPSGGAAAKERVAREGPTPDAEARAVAYFAGGCFWGIEHTFQRGPGVIDAESGYMQGHVDHPTYRQVCSGTTGHAETVKVVYDPRRITFRRLLEAFFEMHDPTQVDRQGPDVGSQYRSGIWVVDEEQRREAEAFVAEFEAAGRYPRPIVTRIEPAGRFWPAEDYHQDYVANTGRTCHVANPW